MAHAPDIVVAAPSRLAQHRAEERVFFSDVRTVIVDEVDTMMSDAFAEDVNRIITPIRVSQSIEIYI